MPARVLYRTHRGAHVYRVVPDDQVSEVMERLWKARIQAAAYDDDDPEQYVGAVDVHPDSGRLSWWADR